MHEKDETQTGWRGNAPAPAPSVEGPGKLSRRGFVQAGAGFVSLAAAGGLFAACGGSDSEEATGHEQTSSTKQVTFGFSMPFAEIPVIATVKSLVKGFAQENGWKVLLDETQGGKVQDQLGTLDTWITQKLTAINMFPGDPSAFEATARRAADAGIIWTTYAVPMKTSAGGVRFPAKLSGEVTGKAAVEWINANDPTAEVLLLEWASGGEPRQRTDIPKKMITEQTKAKIVAVQGAAEQSKGLQVTEDVLQAHPNVTVVVAHNDDGALGAAEAFRKAGKDPAKVWIIGQDGSQDALTALKDPKSSLKASAALDARKVCAEIVGVTKRAIEREWKPGDKQEYIKLAPTLIKAGETEHIDRLLANFK